ncbi:hypothetical protein MYCTH_2122199 [Thermothelomyces thermophilus ATCC 42464]|uniref:Uncharacterized protein n=1 Tax=Thermothelomyces thermophilus (strain ATCC 42464 / BCRC 31852 / DSM 1799) TaxID=573729 RepID=G2Q1R5_THET4|nr:uncharacterized protein MYCTH_2122199 [Thermothelomyces thermophilus ATCC 42464]AEO53349.1 hypothetical protein MYCTH_2122199 [Thermothelomyces thermophilus ATCC 42464]
MPPERFEFFFDLPPEIREQILSYLCLFPTGIWVGGGVGGKSIALSPAAAALLMGKMPTGPQRTATRKSRSTHNGIGGNVDISCGGGGGDSGGGDDGAYGLGDCNADPPVNLFLASPILYREAGDLYYGRNLFHFAFSLCTWGRKKLQQQQGHDQDKEKAKMQQEQQQGDRPISAAAAARNAPRDPSGAALARFLTHADTVRARRRVRSAVVHLGRLGGLVEDLVVPALADLALTGALRRLGVHIGGELFLCVGHPPEALSLVVDREERPHQQQLLQRRQHLGGRDDQDGALAENPALRALLVLLADPSLEKAELRVLWPHRDRFWCNFHPGGWLDERGCRCAVPGRRLSGPYEGALVEMDIPRLVDAFAGDAAAEFNIKKVG